MKNDEVRERNGYERFNKYMNPEISNKLTMQVFVTKMKEIANWYVDEMRRIKYSRKVASTSRPPTCRVPKVPENFYDFIYDPVATSNSKICLEILDIYVYIYTSTFLLMLIIHNTTSRY